VLTVTATSQSDVYGAVDPDHCGNVGLHLRVQDQEPSIVRLLEEC